jgi:hypothetical protein
MQRSDPETISPRDEDFGLSQQSGIRSQKPEIRIQN